MSLDEPKLVDSVLTFPSGYDTLEYSWVKATAVSVRLRILFVTLQNTNTDHKGVSTRPGKVDPVIAAVEGNRHLRPPQEFNRVFEH